MLSYMGKTSRCLFDVLMPFFAERFDVSVVDRSRTEHFLAANADILVFIKYHILPFKGPRKVEMGPFYYGGGGGAH